MTKKSIELATFRNFLSKLASIKNPDDMIAQSQASGLKKTLNAFDLIILGIGAVVGSGIFTVVGIAAAGGNESLGAGPALMVSMVVAAIACVFSALCYSEFASMIPVAGSAYTYTYATMGEFAAWMIGWILMLEYAVGFIAVSMAWTGYLMQFLKGFANILPNWLLNPPLWLIQDYKTAVKNYTAMGIDAAQQIPKILEIPISVNLPGIIMTLIITAILIKGIKESTKMAGVMVIIKLAVIALFIGVGAFYIKPENWTPFAPNGLPGVFMGAFIIFFAYIGFDAIATAAEETKNPQKNLPIGIIGSLVVCTVIYVLVALVLTGISPIGEIDLHAPIAAVMRTVGQDAVAGLISIGALTGLTSVLLVLQLATTRILYAMSRDNLLPSILQKLHPKHKTPHLLTIAVAVAVITGGMFIDINVAAELCNFGTFASFIIVCVAVLILRRTDPHRHRPFRVPFSPLFPSFGILCCAGLMLYSMQFLTTSTLLFPLWMLIGVVIYSTYGYPKKRRMERLETLSLKQTKAEDEIKVEVI